MHNFDDALTEAESYNSIIWCHYDSCALKISLDKYNEVNNGFTFMKSFAQIFHKMDKSDIFEISNGKTVQKCHALFRLYLFSSFEKE